MEDGEWRMENGGWRMEDGEWRMENGEWRMENGEGRRILDARYLMLVAGYSILDTGGWKPGA
jgi:hypothetical protein